MDLQTVIERVRGEFNEMPELRLTRQQAARLLGLDQRSCDEVIDRLVASSFLRWSGGVITRGF